MHDKQSIITALNRFKQRNKFPLNAYQERGLNPPDAETRNTLEKLFNDCADGLMETIMQDFREKRLLSILRADLKKVKRSDYDTEEREIICNYFYELSSIISIDFKDHLNNWLYGKTLGTIFKISSLFRGQEKIIETLTQECRSCGLQLKTLILRKEDGIPDSAWLIIQCNSCHEYNLLSVGPNVKEYRFENYQSIEQLPKSAYTEEQAKNRLEQISFFRKK